MYLNLFLNIQQITIIRYRIHFQDGFIQELINMFFNFIMIVTKLRNRGCYSVYTAK